MMKTHRLGRLFTASVAGSALGVLAMACTSEKHNRTLPLPEVLDCTGAEEVSAIFPVRRRPQPEAGGEVVSLGLGRAEQGKFSEGGSDSGPAFDDGQARHRAAIVCACRARRNRANASETSGWSDLLTVVGAAGTVGGGVVNGVAATDVDSTTRKTLLTTGIVSMGVGALAFGANSALALTKRANAYEVAANDQEYAAAVLWNDKAGEERWSSAWSACVTGQGSEKATRVDNPAAAFEGAARNVEDAGPPANASAGKEATVDALRGIPSAPLDAGK